MRENLKRTSYLLMMSFLVLILFSIIPTYAQGIVGSDVTKDELYNALISNKNDNITLYANIIYWLLGGFTLVIAIITVYWQRQFSVIDAKRKELEDKINDANVLHEKLKLSAIDIERTQMKVDSIVRTEEFNQRIEKIHMNISQIESEMEKKLTMESLTKALEQQMIVGKFDDYKNLNEEMESEYINKYASLVNLDDKNSFEKLFELSKGITIEDETEIENVQRKLDDLKSYSIQLMELFKKNRDGENRPTRPTFWELNQLVIDAQGIRYV